MSERKRKRFDIKEIHDFIDSASTASQQMHYARSRENLEPKRKKESSESTNTGKHTASSKSVHSPSETLAPRVVVRKRESVPKKEEIVFPVAETAEAKKKQEVITFSRVAPSAENLSSEEKYYEVEPYSKEDDLTHKRRKKEPESEPVKKASHGKETWANDEAQKEAESYPESEQDDEGQASSRPQNEDKMSLDEPVGIEVVKEHKPREVPPETLTVEDKKKMKAQEKQMILERRQQEKDAHRLKKEQEKKAREEERAEQQRLQEEERLKEEEKKKTEHLKKEQEKQAIQECKQQEKETQRLKKEQEIKAREEQQGLQQRLKDEERLIEEEKKRAAAEARQKQEEEQRLLKEREKNLRIEQRTLKKKEKQERKQQKEEQKRTPTPATPMLSEAPSKNTATSDQIPSYTPEHLPEESAPAHNEDHRVDSLQPPIENKAVNEEPLIPATSLEPATSEPVSLREDRREQKLLHKEQKAKHRMERIALKERQKQERQQQNRHAKLPERVEVPTTDTTEQKRDKVEEKQTRKDTKKQEREMRMQQKIQRKQEQKKFSAQNLTMRQKEKEWKRQQKEEATRKRKANADILRTTLIEQQVSDDLQKTVEQQQDETNDHAIQEGTDQRKLQALERKSRKVQEKKEKEAQKLKLKEEGNAQKRMELHFEEEVVKEEQSDAGDRITIFDGFDTIDQETAKLLYKNGYTSVEKLLHATLDDLKKIGLKKKIAKDILDECLEFVEWKVIDAEKQEEKIGGLF